MKLLATASSIEEINKIYSAPQKYTITNKIELSAKPPENYKMVSFVASAEEMKIISEDLLKTLDRPEISQQTKEHIFNILAQI